jgi:serine/threonine-protein kinase/endoribonuclease IRE1
MHCTPLIITHLLLFALPFLLLLNATPSPSPAPDPYPAIVSLPSRQIPQTQSQQHLQRQFSTSSTTGPPPQIDHDLLPYVIISTIDGALHAVDRDGGKIRWSLRDGVEPLVGGGVRGKGSGEEYIVEPLSGSLYVFDEEEMDLDADEQGSDSGTGNGRTPPKVRKLPLSVEQLYVHFWFWFLVHHHYDNL